MLPSGMHKPLSEKLQFPSLAAEASLRWLPSQALRQALLFGLYGGLVSGLLYAGFSHWAYDDPFISYRYAENLARGLGFVYNPGLRVLSTTTPLFTLLLALLSPFASDLHSLANLTGSVSIALGGLFLFDLARTWGAPRAGLAALLLYPTFSLLLFTLGSETPLALALCLAAFAFYARRRFSLTAAAGALAILTRPDTALVPLLLGAAYLFERRRMKASGRQDPFPWKAALVFLAITLPWLAFAWAYFGSPLPVTLVAKQHQGTMAISLGFAPGFLQVARDFARLWQYWVEAALALGGLVFVLARDRRWLVFLAWPLAHFAAYALLGVGNYFWYYAPLAPGFLILAGLGLHALSLANVPSLARLHIATPLRLAAALPVGLALLLSLAQAHDLWSVHPITDPRFSIYQAAGSWLQAETPPDTTVGALEVGIIGYYARRPMVDFAGLIQPDISEQLTAWTSFEDSALWAAGRYHSDYIVLQDGALPGFEAEYARSRCRLAQVFHGEEYGSPSDLRIYACPG